jgi:alginate export protein
VLACIALPARAADPDADAIDLTLYRDGDSYLRPTLALESAIFAEKNAWHGESRRVIGDAVGYWWEWAFTGGLDGALALGDWGALFGRASAIAARSQGLDAAGSNVDDRYAGDVEADDAYLGWRSGDLLPGLGRDALELSVGKQHYQIGNGFFLLDGATDGGERGAFWLAPRKAFYMSAVARLTTGPYRAELFYLRPNDHPFSSTDAVGGNFEYTAGETGTIGFTYMKVVGSDNASRSGLDLFDWRAALTPLPVDRALSLGAEYATELRSGRSHADAWYTEAGYTFEQRPWTPFLGYRYSQFSGDRPSSRESELWDPLFYGYHDWSTWYVGEIMGNFVAQNRDLRMHTARLSLHPHETLTTQLIYNYYALLEPVTRIAARDENPRAANIRSHHLGQSFDLVTDWAPKSWLSFTGTVSALDPGAGMRQYVEADSRTWWLHFMLYAKVSF